MCGRFTLSTPAERLAELFGLDEVPSLAPRYNIAPSQGAPAVRLTAEGKRHLELLHWGLVPSWAKELSVGYRMINARAETAAEKPAFRKAMRERRCLVLADGFYEWQKRGRGRKQPWYIALKDRRPFAFAGLWERWHPPAAEGATEAAPVLQSCTLLTTQPNALVAELHDRMPVILQPGDYDAWLDPAERDPEKLKPLLRAFPAEEMVAFEVSSRVSSPVNDDPGCCAPLPTVESLLPLLDR
jgi:putative SOS response-associated peptidase YedK